LGVHPEETIVASDNHSDSAINRRHLLRGGTLAAAGAGAAVLASAVAPSTVFAADGDAVLLGADHEASTTTSLTLGGDLGSSDPTLALGNANGPALRLEPLPANWAGGLAVGDIATTPSGPLVGVENNGGATTTRLSTQLDLDDLINELPMTITFPPERLLDTRWGAVNDERILTTSASAIDAAYRLKSKAWLDLKLVESDQGFTVHSVFLKLTSVASLGNGYLTAYQPGPRPASSSANYVKGQILGSAAFVAVGIVDNNFAVRIYASQTTHVVVDVTGAVIQNLPPAQALATGRRASRFTKAVDVMRRGLATR
jgi:hypothetical protein